ncbi:MAG: hypothetical protein LBF62_08310 [Tannerellaceae bacterium]|jgi:hypothetical protein|nr:hypothetical protein [Tannerellaceae bacterium]
MKSVKYGMSILLFSLLPLLSNGQSTVWDYQLIVELKNQYNHPDKASIINKDNRMKIDKLSSLTELYPVVTAGNDWGGLLNTLQAEGNLTNYNFDKDSVRFTFRELYTRFSWKGSHHWTVGKKRLDWGTGMLWNPTNFYIQKDPFRTQNRLEGIFQLNYTCLFTTGSLDVYVFPGKKAEDFSYSLKYNYTGKRIDASVSFLEYTRYQQIGYDISYGGDRFITYAEGVFRNYSKSYRVGKEGELIPPRNRAARFYPEIVSGVSYAFNASLGARLEYRFREDFLSREEVADFKKYLPQNSIIYDPVSIGKHTLYASAEIKDIYDRLNMQVRTFFDLFSNQLIVSPLFVWKKNNFQIELSSMIFANSLAVFDSQTALLLSCHF